jgi:hypothetical protein
LPVPFLDVSFLEENASSNQQTTEARLAKSPQVLSSSKAWTAKIPQKGPLQEKIEEKWGQGSTIDIIK